MASAKEPRYSGEVDAQGKPNGKGAYKWPDGSIYTGVFVHGVMTEGTTQLENGNVYVGQLDNGDRHGKGCHVWRNGDVYEGDFVHGTINGQGTYWYSNGDKYEGHWKDGKRHGFGIEYIKNNGSFFYCYWGNNQPREGLWINSSGHCYQGTFLNHKMHGKGIYTWPNGKTKKGEFKRGKFINQKDSKVIPHVVKWYIPDSFLNSQPKRCGSHFAAIRLPSFPGCYLRVSDPKELDVQLTLSQSSQNLKDVSPKDMDDLMRLLYSDSSIEEEDVFPAEGKIDISRQTQMNGPGPLPGARARKYSLPRNRSRTGSVNSESSDTPKPVALPLFSPPSQTKDFEDTPPAPNNPISTNLPLFELSNCSSVSSNETPQEHLPPIHPPPIHPPHQNSLTDLNQNPLIVLPGDPQIQLHAETSLIQVSAETSLHAETPLTQNLIQNPPNLQTQDPYQSPILQPDPNQNPQIQLPPTDPQTTTPTIPTTSAPTKDRKLALPSFQLQKSEVLLSSKSHPEISLPPEALSLQPKRIPRPETAKLLQKATPVDGRKSISVLDQHNPQPPSFEVKRLPSVHGGLPLPKARGSLSDTYTISTLLGEGASSQVWLAKHVKTEEYYAVKVVPRRVLIGNSVLAKEIKILKTLQHPRIVRLIDVFVTIDALQIVMEFAEGVELFEEISGPGKKFTENDAKEVIRMVLEGVEYIHAQGIIHRDLKPENLIWLDDPSTGKKTLKIIDFGFARFSNESAKESTSGTLGYKPPEVISPSLNIPQSTKSDMWSIGVISYILLCGFPPFFSFSEDASDDWRLSSSPFWTLFNEKTDELVNSITLGTYAFPPTFWDSVSENAKDFVRNLLKVSPEQRMSAEEALKHPWMSN
eukprot:TRINITY_DN8209_c0_g1_i1.p1 TRINITY_DN8209_c0_g1~~TRINITY_DN8209_c0_g1_i1.p1  ORF type:complete len:867 (+),score=202.01 TRINITY_DN8209_c0_g1_i1:1-2601(+)